MPENAHASKTDAISIIASETAAERINPEVSDSDSSLRPSERNFINSSPYKVWCVW
jgi:hypothetical protein